VRTVRCRAHARETARCRLLKPRMAPLSTPQWGRTATQPRAVEDRLGNIFYAEADHHDPTDIGGTGSVTGMDGIVTMMDVIVIRGMMPPGRVGHAIVRGDTGAALKAHTVVNGVGTMMSPVELAGNRVAAKGPVGGGAMPSRS
jgi:hypothetical protein